MDELGLAGLQARRLAKSTLPTGLALIRLPKLRSVSTANVTLAREPVSLRACVQGCRDGQLTHCPAPTVSWCRHDMVSAAARHAPID